MPCSCATRQEYTYTSPSGQASPFRTLNEALAAQRRAGGGGTIAKTK